MTTNTATVHTLPTPKKRARKTLTKADLQVRVKELEEAGARWLKASTWAMGTLTVATAAATPLMGTVFSTAAAEQYFAGKMVPAWCFGGLAFAVLAVSIPHVVHGISVATRKTRWWQTWPLALAIDAGLIASKAGLYLDWTPVSAAALVTLLVACNMLSCGFNVVSYVTKS